MSELQPAKWQLHRSMVGVPSRQGYTLSFKLEGRLFIRFSEANAISSNYPGPPHLPKVIMPC